jgi:hypothetical protein
MARENIRMNSIICNVVTIRKETSRCVSSYSFAPVLTANPEVIPYSAAIGCRMTRQYQALVSGPVCQCANKNCLTKGSPHCCKSRRVLN